MTLPQGQNRLAFGTDNLSLACRFALLVDLHQLIELILILPALLRVSWREMGSRFLKPHSFRGLVHGSAVMLWFYAMARIPIAEATAIGYTAPIFVTIGAAFFLGERLQFRRTLAIGIGFVGTLIILRPGFQGIGLGQMAQLTAAPLFACSFILAKELTDRRDPAVIVAMLSVFVTLALLPGAIMQWRPPTLEEMMLLALTAVFATLGHYTMTKAIQAAALTTTRPVGFWQIVWVALLGVILFSEALDPFVLPGGGIIVAAATYISHREAKIARREAREAALQVAGA